MINHLSGGVPSHVGTRAPHHSGASIMLRKITLGALAFVAAATTMPEAAEAQGRYYRDYDYGYYDRYPRGEYYRGYDRRGYDRRYDRRRYGDRRYYGRRCGDGTTGAIIGGAAGALIGREVARGDRRGYRSRYRRGGDGTVGALIGGAAGALIGREIGRSC